MEKREKYGRGEKDLRELEVEILRSFTNLQNPVLDYFAWFLTFLGNEEFYFIILPFVFWCISKGFGIRLLYVFIISVYINSFIKVLTAVTRPINVEGVNSLFIDSAEVGSHYPHDSFPSGHAQGSATLWGFIAYKVNRRNVWLALGLLVLLISLARLYTGVHWPLDIIVGIAIAVIVITVYHFVEKGLSGLGDIWKITLAVIVPVIMILLFPHSEGYSYGGFLLGAGLGYFLEKKYVSMKIPFSWGRKITAYIIGAAGLFALQAGLKLVLPEADIFSAVRYAVMGLWGIWLAPYLFVKTGLYKRS
ncbi:phosphatase PAP2 family protein [Evansella sp. LMS18]|uniref:phosphatase PAP2 family protein n=1 Tax=Evansella sp. LMS18 TaxID=2924033 RepID=UPI0020CFECEE|nr:phosphatase PAP2 family protein [Evansella sp. LMS18]UTR11191.1 phosphatase PAP2 family protein [Evansella sp. LMS18]